jgi:D-glycero-D-manno-heptose 1,7-bisphosphate phosphatase
MRRLIILDRDGVINSDSDDYIKTEEEFIPIPGSLDAIAKLCQAGYTVVVATNQSGIARHYFNLETLSSMHDKLQNLLAPLKGKIDHFYFCPHAPDDNCSCRKPKPGLILNIIEDYCYSDRLSIEDVESITSKIYFIGDSLRDLQAGISAGCKVALVTTGKGDSTLKKISNENLSEFKNIPVFDDLAHFTEKLLNNLLTS